MEQRAIGGKFAAEVQYIIFAKTIARESADRSVGAMSGDGRTGICGPIPLGRLFNDRKVDSNAHLLPLENAHFARLLACVAEQINSATRPQRNHLEKNRLEYVCS